MASPVIAENAHYPLRLIKWTRGGYKIIKRIYLWTTEESRGSDTYYLLLV